MLLPECWDDRMLTTPLPRFYTVADQTQDFLQAMWVGTLPSDPCLWLLYICSASFNFAERISHTLRVFWWLLQYLLHIGTCHAHKNTLAYFPLCTSSMALSCLTISYNLRCYLNKSGESRYPPLIPGFREHLQYFPQPG